MRKPAWLLPTIIHRLAGLGNLIEAEPDLELVGQGTSGHSALKMIRDKLPDVAIVDISMPEIERHRIGTTPGTKIPQRARSHFDAL